MELELSRLRRLMAILVALVAMLVVGAGVGAFLGARQLAKFQALVSKFETDPTAAKSRTDGITEIIAEVSVRQAQIATALDERADVTQAAVKVLKQERQKLEKVRGGPVDKISQVIELMQLMSDQMFVLVDHAAATQESLARTLRPIEPQKKLLQGRSSPADKR